MNRKTKNVVPAQVESASPALFLLNHRSLIPLSLALFLLALWGGNFPTPAKYVPAGDAVGLIMEIWTVPLANILIVSGFLLAIMEGWRDKNLPARLPLATLLLALFAIWCGLSLSSSQIIAVSLNALTTVCCAVFSGFIAFRVGSKPEGRLFLTFTIAIVGTLVALFGVMEYLQSVREGVIEHRVFATFINPTFLAGYLLLTIPLTLTAFLTANTPLLRFLMGFSLVIQTTCLNLTGSRAGVAFLVGGSLLAMVLFFTSKAFQPHRKTIALSAGLVVLGLLFGIVPTFSRVAAKPSPQVQTAPQNTQQTAPQNIQQAAGSQNHSGEFRAWTRKGTMQMALANPILGTGLATFETAYPRYSETAFTAHAHNGYLQIAAETGFVGLALLLAALIIVAVKLFLIVYKPSEQSSTVTTVVQGETKSSNPSPTTHHDDVNLKFLSVGILFSLAGTLLHCITDSDWHIVAIAIMLGTLLGLASALGEKPLFASRPALAAWFVIGIGVVGSLFVVWRTSAFGPNRWNRMLAEFPSSPREGREAANTAANADPFDSDSRLLLARYADSEEVAERNFKEAVNLASIGRNHYQCGKFYVARQKWQEARTSFENARKLEPRNLQALRGLAETLVQIGDTSAAIAVYKEMVALSTAPYGTVRAMPELIETDFAYAHAGLASLAASPEEQRKERGQALEILRTYWSRRNWLINLSRPLEKRTEIANFYLNLLDAEAKSLNVDLNKVTSQHPVVTEHQRVKTELDADLAEQKQTP